MSRLLLVTILVMRTGLMSGCDTNDGEPLPERDYRQDMRDFVQDISAYAKGSKANFIVIPQNGHELLTTNGEETGTPAAAYLNAIDGVGREDMFYGYNDDDLATPVSERDYIVSVYHKLG